ncbi:Trk system potassium transporter TrkA [Stratiformator vulcanicus]|uniref:Trk system potassium uptake protein TrkA n=1 Tax=Stratiformator vulcanicus TaxID=2527980 RepID=A0A517QXU4_9PLAN|nr:Trk system potassium transporter TrkA [Stratiformator vulcanicus]QDT36459.1 Trk system potassium uptake protein TrkA [Stratiformator vulcanicus]
MNIVILGGGTVGTSIARTLCNNGHDVCLVDSSRDVLDRLEESLDIQTVRGNGCDAVTLFQAGVQSADLYLGVTNLDEVNLIGSSLAKQMGAARSVARIYNEAYRDASTFDYRRHFGVDRLLSLEFLTALELAKSIRARGLFTIENFLRGGVEVQEVAVEPHSRAAGKKLFELKMRKGVRIGFITRDRQTRIATAEDLLEPGIFVTLMGTSDSIAKVKSLFESGTPERMRVVIGGGGEIGYNLARVLERGRFETVILESDAQRCEELASKLDHATVLNADVTRRAEMEDARVGKCDAFVAATGRDEDNIICGVEARELGAKKIMSVVRRPDYANVLGKLGIDAAVSPRQVMARQVLGMVQSGVVMSRYDVAGGEAEVYEVEVVAGSPITESPLKEQDLSHGIIAAIERENFVKVPGADDTLKAGDIALVLAQSATAEDTLKPFQPVR